MIPGSLFGHRRNEGSLSGHPYIQGSPPGHRRDPRFVFRPSTQRGFASWTFKGRKRLWMATTRTLVERTDKARTRFAWMDRIRTRFSRAKTGRGTKPSEPSGRGCKSGLARPRICTRHAVSHPRRRPRLSMNPRIHLPATNRLPGSLSGHRRNEGSPPGRLEAENGFRWTRREPDLCGWPQPEPSLHKRPKPKPSPRKRTRPAPISRE